MMLSMAIAVLCLSIAYYQMVQGLLSSLIMCVLTILCVCLSFELYEWVAYTWLVSWKPDLALALALMGTFVVPLIIARAIADLYLRRACLLPMLIDRVGGAALGIITGLLIGGMLANALLYLPFGGGFLGYATVDHEEDEVRGLLLGPDRFAVAMASLLSSGTLSGPTPFADAHPNLTEEIAWGQTGMLGSSPIAPQGSITVTDRAIINMVYKRSAGGGRSGYEPVDPKAGRHWFMVSVRLGHAAADPDGNVRFTPYQMRLIGRDRPDDVLTQYHAQAMTDGDNPSYQITPDLARCYATEADAVVDFVFSVPESFVPQEVAFKHGAHAAVEPIESDEEPTGDSAPPERASAGDRKAAAPSATPSGGRGRRGRDRDGNDRTGRTSALASSRDANGDGAAAGGGSRPATAKVKSTPGRTGAARAQAEHTRFSNDLPVELTEYAGADVVVNANAASLGEGHLVAHLDRQEEGSRARVSRFAVPAEKRLLQLSVQQLQAGSVLGRAKSFAVRSLQNYVVSDATGNRYPVVGQYAIARARGGEVLEIQYYPQAGQITGRVLRPFKTIQPDDLSARGAQLSYLFLVPPGSEIVEFSTGGAQRSDLRGLGLTAPQ